jgi:hypothetical protein
MAGGRSWFLYTTDAGVEYALNQDTSNGLAMLNTAAGVGVESLPRYIKPRWAMYASSDGLKHRKCYVGSVAQMAALPATLTSGDDASSVLFTLLYTQGERARRSRANSGVLT